MKNVYSYWKKSTFLKWDLSIIIFLGLIVFYTFFESLYIPPRADQHMILFQFQQFNGVLDLINHVVSWPRSILRGDVHVYRPLGNIILALQFSFFGYEFKLYQAFGIFLHLFLIMLLYLVFVFTLHINRIVSGLMCLCYALYMLPAEAVIWHHMNQMVIFSIILITVVVLNAYSFQKRIISYKSISLMTIGAFIIDQGAVLLLFSIYGIGIFILHFVMSKNNRDNFHLKFAVVCFIMFCIVISINIYDLYHTGWSIENLRQPAHSNAPHLLRSVYEIIFFWVHPFLFPTQFTFTPGGRLSIIGTPSSTITYYVNLVAVLIVPAFFLASLALRGRNSKFYAGLNNREAGPRTHIAVTSASLCLLFVLMFAVGRGMSRGLEFALGNGLHTAHPFFVCFILLLAATFSWCSNLLLNFRNWINIIFGIILLFGVTVHHNVVVNTLHEFKEYFARDRAVYSAVLQAARNSRDNYKGIYEFSFSFEKNCNLNYQLPWFHRGMTIANAAFPQWYKESGGVNLGCPAISRGAPVSLSGPINGPYSIAMAFDRSRAPNSFFETGEIPVEFEASLSRPGAFSGYTFSSGQTGERMPKHWVVEARSGGVWANVDDRRVESPWKQNEERTFRIQRVENTDAIRIRFLASFSHILRIYEIDFLVE